jgi:multiple sugar transport system ATP-binding protein
MTMGTRIAVMQHGILQQLATPQEIYDHPVNQFVAGFIGSPAMNFLSGHLRRSERGIDLTVDTAELPLPPNLADRLAHRVDQPVVAGLRPEAITRPNGANQLNLPVEVVEPMGSDVYVTFRIGTQTLTGRFDPRHHPRAGESEAVSLSLEHAHFFDPETGLALRDERRPLAA